jgi:5'-nucleotidase
MLILLTNDDGYRAAGLRALREALAGHGRVVTVAPAREMSGVGHALTLSRPLSVEELGEDLLVVDGTPTDCVNLALNELVPERPDVVVAGINHGPNLGDDVTYSGTVGAALEGTLFGLPSVAVSQLGADPDSDFGPAAAFTAGLLRPLVGSCRLPPNTLLNVNVPPGSPRAAVATRLARRTYTEGILRRGDPRGRTYYWVGGRPVWEDEPGTDRHAVTALGAVSVSLLSCDLSAGVPGAGRTDPPAGCLDASLEPLLAELGEALPGPASAGGRREARP